MKHQYHCSNLKTSYKVGAGFLLIFSLFLYTNPAQAQINFASDSKIERENRQALREAKKYQSPYKDSHLKPHADILRGKKTNKSYKRYQKKKEKYRFDKKGNAIKNKKKFNLFNRKR